MRLVNTLYLSFLVLYLLLRFLFGDRFWALSLVNTFAPFVFLPLILVLLTAWRRKIRWQLAAAGLGLLVAAFWFGPYFLPKSPVKTSAETFTVVSYNMHALTGGLFEWLELLEPDLVLLQEVPQDFLETLPKSLTERYPYRLTQPQLYKGNAVLSRYPITNSDELTGFGEYVPQRLELDLGGRTVAVYNVHLAWSIGNRRLPRNLTPGPLHLLTAYNDSERNRDLKRLMTALEKETQAFIVGGDFNLSQHSAGYQQLSRVAKDSFRQAGRGWGNTWYLHPYLPPLLRIDYLWHSDALISAESSLGPRLASDHLPFVSTFFFKD